MAAATLANVAYGVWPSSSSKSSQSRQFDRTLIIGRRRVSTCTVDSLSGSSSLFFALNSSSTPKFNVVARLPHSSSSSSSSSSSKTAVNSSTKLYVSGLSFRTTEETLRNAFVKFGQLVEVNLVMDRIAKRPRGFAFLRYATEVESRNAIEGMHGQFLDGRVIFVEVAKPRSETRQQRSIQ